MFVGVMGYLILGERFTKFDVAGLFIVFIGVILISNPFEEEDTDLYPHQFIGSAIALFGAVTSAVAMIAIRKLSG